MAAVASSTSHPEAESERHPEAEGASASASASAPAKSAGAGGNAPTDGAGSIVLGGKLKEKRAGPVECFDEEYDWGEEISRHFYPRVLNANLHPVVRSLFGMSTESIIVR
jgi:hypothetical protein